MEVDGRTLGNGAVVETDVCIIGAGPAGLVAARALAERGRDVLVLESGARDSEPETQVLNEGDVMGDAYAGLRETRHRGLGGTTAMWNTPVGDALGAKYAPLSPIDFEWRPSVEHSGWPITSAELTPWYVHAQELCGLGPFEYDGGAWGHCLRERRSSGWRRTRRGGARPARWRAPPAVRPGRCARSSTSSPRARSRTPERSCSPPTGGCAWTLRGSAAASWSTHATAGSRYDPARETFLEPPPFTISTARPMGR
jgi:hypothetical protein